MNWKENVWLHNSILLAVLAALVWVGLSSGSQVQAGGGGWETDGVLALTTDPTQRIVLIDTTKKTLCVYRTQAPGQFRLVCARSYKYDVELKDYPDAVETRVENAGNGVNYFVARQILKDAMDREKKTRPTP